MCSFLRVSGTMLMGWSIVLLLWRSVGRRKEKIVVIVDIPLEMRRLGVERSLLCRATFSRMTGCWSWGWTGMSLTWFMIIRYFPPPQFSFLFPYHILETKPGYPALCVIYIYKIYLPRSHLFLCVVFLRVESIPPSKMGPAAHSTPRSLASWKPHLR